MAVVFLSLGSNLGDRTINMQRALELIAGLPNTSVERVSSMYETEPMGYTDQPDFLNAAAMIETELRPRELLDDLLSVELAMGRVRDIRWGPRVIDLDILLFGEVEMESAGLTIPHPRMAERAFVLAPLAEIAPDLVLPDGRRPGEALASLGDQRIHKVEP